MGEGNGKTALVTGGSRGYGLAIARKLVNEGFRVVIAARDREQLRAAQDEIGCEAVLEMDVTAPRDWERAFSLLQERFGGLDVLVNNAGGAVSLREVGEQSVEAIDSIVALNLSGVIYGCRIFGKAMKERRSGTIVNIASVCATHAWPGFSVYAAAKAGVLALSKGLHVELRPHDVRVTCILPAAGATDFMKHAGEENFEVRLRAEDIGETVAWVCRQPAHVVIEEMTVWGIDQEVVPL